MTIAAQRSETPVGLQFTAYDPLAWHGGSLIDPETQAALERFTAWLDDQAAQAADHRQPIQIGKLPWVMSQSYTMGNPAYWDISFDAQGRAQIATPSRIFEQAAASADPTPLYDWNGDEHKEGAVANDGDGWLDSGHEPGDVFVINANHTAGASGEPSGRRDFSPHDEEPRVGVLQPQRSRVAQALAGLVAAVLF